MITFYGSPNSSASRTHWMLEEVGAPYVLRVIDVANAEHKRPEYLAVNPNGLVPCIVDGALSLSESIAINFYLAERYAPNLLPTDVATRAQVFQWSLWAITNVAPPVLTAALQRRLLPPGERDVEIAEQASARVAPFLQVLDAALVGREYLVGDAFSVADVNAGSVIHIAANAGLLAGRPSAEAWLARLRVRPAFVKVYGA